MLKKLILFLLLSSLAYAQTPVWFKVGVDGDKVTASTTMTARWGAPKGTVRTFPDSSATLLADSWSTNLTFTNTVIVGNFAVLDPAFGYVKEFDVLETNVQQIVTVNGVQKIVPAFVPPPPPVTVIKTLSCSSAALTITLYSDGNSTMKGNYLCK